MQEDLNMRVLHLHVTIADRFAAWLRDHANELFDAVELLGGPQWLSRAVALVGQASGVDHLFACQGELRALQRLLHLEYADWPDSEEAARFAAVHPDDPRADTARLCAEALDRGIEAIETLRREGIRKMGEAA